MKLFSCPGCGRRYTGRHTVADCVAAIREDALRLSRQIGCDDAPTIAARRLVLTGRIR